MNSMPLQSKRSNHALRQEICKYWAARIDECGMPIDWDQAMTHRWACAGETQTQLCHIVPDMLGGKIEPSNIVLMCRSCHNVAPDSINADYMWSWIRSCGPTGRLRRDAEHELRTTFHEQRQDLLSKINFKAAVADMRSKGTSWIDHYVSAAHEGIGIHYVKATNMAIAELEFLKKLGQDFPKMVQSP